MARRKEPDDQFWYACSVVVDPRALEAVAYGLLEAGANGTETTEVQGGFCVTGYFSSCTERDAIRTALSEALRIYSVPLEYLLNITFNQTANDDWLSEWKKHWKPVAIGDRFIVAPPWSDIPHPDGRFVIRIEPGMAFGTGTHESTRLCLMALEKYFKGGSLLDVGTGTGILAIAAAKMRPDAIIEACDTDPEAIQIARSNAAVNGVSDNIFFREGAITAGAEAHDCVCANLSLDVFLTLLPQLVSARQRRLILSGLLSEQEDFLLGTLDSLGLQANEIMTDGEWIAAIV